MRIRTHICICMQVWIEVVVGPKHYSFFVYFVGPLLLRKEKSPHLLSPASLALGICLLCLSHNPDLFVYMSVCMFVYVGTPM